MEGFFTYGFWILLLYVLIDIALSRWQKRTEEINEQKMVGSRIFPIIEMSRHPFDKGVSKRADNWRKIIAEQNQIRIDRGEQALNIEVIEIHHSDASAPGEDFYWSYHLRVADILLRLGEIHGNNLRKTDAKWFKNNYQHQN